MSSCRCIYPSGKPASSGLAVTVAGDRSIQLRPASACLAGDCSRTLSTKNPDYTPLPSEESVYNRIEDRAQFRLHDISS